MGLLSLDELFSLVQESLSCRGITPRRAVVNLILCFFLGAFGGELHLETGSVISLGTLRGGSLSLMSSYDFVVVDFFYMY